MKKGFFKKKEFFKHIGLISLLLIMKVQQVNAEEELLMMQLNDAFASGSVYVVDQKGTGDFVSIQEGVDSVTSGDTLLIYPGIYEEAVDIIDKTVNLLGVSKEHCVIQYDTSSYYKVPLNLGAGKIANLTIHGMNITEDKDQEVNIYLGLRNSQAVNTSVWQSFFSGYAIHIDQDYSYGKDISFTNCKIVSDNNHCVGMGCRGNSTIQFIDCEFLAGGDGGCTYIHDTPIAFLGGVSNIKFLDCTLTNYINPYLMTFHSMLDTNRINLTFQNVKVSTVVYDDMEIYVENNHSTAIDARYSPNLSAVWDKEKSKKYVKAIQQEGVLNNKVELNEGITLLKIKKDIENTVHYNKQCSTLLIYNETERIGYGWCGLENVFLTEDSFGNSLMEMNYIQE